jgi:hypothetical protein
VLDAEALREVDENEAPVGEISPSIEEVAENEPPR